MHSNKGVQNSSLNHKNNYQTMRNFDFSNLIFYQLIKKKKEDNRHIVFVSNIYIKIFCFWPHNHKNNYQTMRIFYFSNLIFYQLKKKKNRTIRHIGEVWNAPFNFCMHLHFGSNTLYVWNIYLHFIICVYLQLIWHNSHFDSLLNNYHILFKMLILNIIHNYITF